MNGYIQIVLGGESRALKFNMHAVEIISQHGTTTEHGNLTIFIYAGLCGNSFAKSSGAKPICDESFEDISEWAEDIILSKNNEVKGQIINAFAGSKPMQQLEEAAKKMEEGKKKSLKKT